MHLSELRATFKQFSQITLAKLQETQYPLDYLTLLSHIRNTLMPTGTVNRFNKIKGYGFIAADNYEGEIFVHFSEVEMAGYKELHIGQRISYECKETDRGPCAVNVKVITD